MVAIITSFCGILVLAVPITIISTNFNEQYDKLKRSRQKVRARMLLLKSQFKSRRSGLDAMVDEVEELVQRNTMELRKDVEELFEQSALELKEEIKSLVKLAYKQRRKQQRKDEQERANEVLRRVSPSHPRAGTPQTLTPAPDGAAAARVESPSGDAQHQSASGSPPGIRQP